MDFGKNNLRSLRASNLIENIFSMITFRENLVYMYILHTRTLCGQVYAQVGIPVLGVRVNKKELL